MGSTDDPRRPVIEIKEDTRRDLRVFKAKRDMTYDEAIRELLSAYPEDAEGKNAEGQNGP